MKTRVNSKHQIYSSREIIHVGFSQAIAREYGKSAETEISVELTLGRPTASPGLD
jgi:hypothetical protein